MKKKWLLFFGLAICLVIICILLGLNILRYTPIKMELYLNGRLVEDACAYCYDGSLFLPVLGTMKLYGYEIDNADARNPEFVIDGISYRLEMDNGYIVEGDHIYIGVYTGGRSFLEKNGDLYTFVGEIDEFFLSIGKEPIDLVRTDWKQGKVYLKIESKSEEVSSK